MKLQNKFQLSGLRNKKLVFRKISFQASCFFKKRPQGVACALPDFVKCEFWYPLCEFLRYSLR
jgi:hypothetical protein